MSASAAPTAADALLPESLHYRVRADECRAMAAHFRVDFARRHMMQAADDFERMARYAREREIVHGVAELVGSLHRLR